MNAEDRCFCELAPLYVLNLLTEEERRWVEEQTVVNLELAAELAEHQATVNALPYSAPSIPLVADLKDRLLERIAQEPVGDAVAESLPPALTVLPDRVLQLRADISPVASTAPPIETPQPIDSAQTARRATSIRQRNIVWLQVAGTIAAVSAIALLADNYRLRQNAQNERAIVQSAQNDRAIVASLQQPDSLVYTLKGTEKATSASGNLVVNSSEKAAVVLLHNLPELPAGQAYRLWAIPKGATKPAYCGQFNSRNSTIRWTLPETACSASIAQMLITAESVSAPPVPAGPLVMKSAS